MKLRIFADPVLFDGTTWGHVATIEDLTQLITDARAEGVIRADEKLTIKFRNMTDEEVEQLPSI